MSDNSRIGFGQPVLLNRIAEADRNNDGDQYESDLDLPFWVKAEIGALEQRIYAAMDTLALRLTVRMGVMLAAGLSLVVALIGLLVRLR